MHIRIMISLITSLANLLFLKLKFIDNVFDVGDFDDNATKFVDNFIDTPGPIQSCHMPYHIGPIFKMIWKSQVRCSGQWGLVSSLSSPKKGICNSLANLDCKGIPHARAPNFSGKTRQINSLISASFRYCDVLLLFLPLRQTAQSCLVFRIARPTSLAIWHRGYSHRRPNRSGSPNRRHFASLDLKEHLDFRIAGQHRGIFADFS